MKFALSFQSFEQQFINTTKIVDLVVTQTGQIIIKLAAQYTLEIKGSLLCC